MRTCTVSRRGYLAEIESLVGAAHVSTAPAVLDRLARTTLPEGTRPALRVRPGSVAEVQQVVRWAAWHDLAIYPISGGRNWGYGDACAPTDGCLLLDLSRLNRILEVNTELAYAVVEPGVTQGQLYQYLQDHDLPLWVDATGAGPDASVLGNILERGVGLSPYSDRFAHACALEVVLPDGELLRTGFGAYAGSQAQHLCRAGIGPALDGLFTQSNLGIVTRLTFWLLPRPECFTAFFIRLRDRDAIAPLVEALRPLRLHGTVRSSVHCFNDLRLLGGSERYPWDRADGRQALDVQHPELVRELLDRHGIPAWLATGALSGTRAEVAAARRVVQRALRGVPGVRLNFVDAAALRRIDWLRRQLARWGVGDRFRRRLDKVALWTRFLQGRSDYQTLHGAHWRARGTPGGDADPLDSGAGLLWVCPVLPMTAAATREVSLLGQRCCQRFGFEYQVTLSQVSDRALCAVMSIHYDRRNPEETARAGACHDALVDALLERGYVPYRGAPRTVARLRGAAPVFWDVAGQIKQALDPHERLAPGRYIPPREE